MEAALRSDLKANEEEIWDGFMNKLKVTFRVKLLITFHKSEETSSGEIWVLLPSLIAVKLRFHWS